MERKRWTEEELFRVLTLYCELPFGQLHSKNPKIIKLAGELNRTPSAIALKLVNFASLDPTIEQKGMSNVSALDKKVWNKFFDMIDYYLSTVSSSNEDRSGFEDQFSPEYILESTRSETELVSAVTMRRGQNRFRNAVLASYNYRCAISGISDTRLLVASHIAPWATHVGRRLDPRNGICLNYLLDKAFDAGIISISKELKVIFSPKASYETVNILEKTGLIFHNPHRFVPDPALLEEHARRFGFID